MICGVDHCLFIKLQINKMSFPREKRLYQSKNLTTIFYCVFHFFMVYAAYIPSLTAIHPIERLLREFKQGNFNYNHPVYIYVCIVQWGKWNQVLFFSNFELLMLDN